MNFDILMPGEYRRRLKLTKGARVVHVNVTPDFLALVKAGAQIEQRQIHNFVSMATLLYAAELLGEDAPL